MDNKIFTIAFTSKQLLYLNDAVQHYSRQPVDLFIGCALK